MPKLLEQAFSNYEDFKKEDYTVQYEVANEYWRRNVDPGYWALPDKERAAIRENFIHEEIGSSVSGGDGLVDFMVNGLREGTANVIQALPGAVTELLGNYSPMEEGFFGSEDLYAASDWWGNLAKGVSPTQRPTGIYSRPPEGIKEHLDPKRLGYAALKGAPLNALLWATYLRAPVLGSVIMGVVEGGSEAAELRKAEEAGADIPEWQRKLVPLGVGFVNQFFERVFPDQLRKSMTRTVGNVLKNTLYSVLVEGTTEGIQETVSVLGSLGYDDATIRDTVDRIHLAAYEGAASGGAWGAGRAVMAPAPVKSETKATEVPVGAASAAPTETVVTSSMLNEAIAAYKEAWAKHETDPDLENTSMAKHDAETRLIQRYRIEFPKDPAGVGLEKILMGKGIPPSHVVARMKGSVISAPADVNKPIKIPKRVEENESFVLKISTPNGLHHIAVSVHPGVARERVERALTAFNSNKDLYLPAIDKVSEIKVLPDSKKQWIAVALDAGAIPGMPEGSDILAGVKSSAKIYKQLIASMDAYLGEQHGAVVDMPDGSYKVILRGMSGIPKGATGKAKVGTPSYAYMVGHEMSHVTDFMSGVEQAPIGTEERKAQEEKANKAGEAARKAIQLRPSVLFSATNPKDISMPEANHLTQIFRLADVISPAFADFKIAAGQLYSDTSEAGDGKALTEVNGFVDPRTNTLWLSKDVAPWVLGHEATELVMHTLGESNEIVKKGIELFGDKEKLADVSGRYFANQHLEATLAQRFAQWLKELWSEFTRIRGAQLAQQDIVNLLNRRIKSWRYFTSDEHTADLQERRGVYSRLAQAWREEYERLKPSIPGSINFSMTDAAIALEKATMWEEHVDEIDQLLKAAAEPKFSLRHDIPTTLKFYDNLANMRTNVNLSQLPLKNINKEEAAFVQSVAQDLIDAGEKVVSPERLKQAIEAAKIPVTVETELIESQRGQPANITGYTIPGIYNLATHHRWLFTTPIEFGEPAHSGIDATNAIGWAEVAEKKDDAKTLIVFEVQPSDKIKAVIADKGAPDIAFIPYEIVLSDLKDAAAANMDVNMFNDHQGFRVSGDVYTAISDENSIKLVGTPDQVAKHMTDFFNAATAEEWSVYAPNNIRLLAPHVNSLMYRSILRVAAEDGYEKVLFPVGDTVEQIEGTEAPRELYDRMAARMEKEQKGKTERITKPVQVFDEEFDNIVVIPRPIEGPYAIRQSILKTLESLGIPETILTQRNLKELDSIVKDINRGEYYRQGVTSLKGGPNTPTVVDISYRDDDNTIVFEPSHLVKIMEQRDAWLQVSLSPEHAQKPVVMFSKKQTESLEFKKWFGNSKVVDSSGNPLVVYHGTETGDISEFRPMNHFGTQQAASDRLLSRFETEGHSIYPVLLHIENPFEGRDAGPDDPSSWETAMLQDMSDKGIISKDDLTTYSSLVEDDKYESVRLFIMKSLEAKGYDGIVYENKREDVGSKTWVNFRANQVKSAIGNRGTFSPTEDNLLFSRKQQEEFGAPAQGKAKINTAWNKKFLDSLLPKATAQTERQEMPKGKLHRNAPFGTPAYVDNRAIQNQLDRTDPEIRELLSKILKLNPPKGEGLEPWALLEAQAVTLAGDPVKMEMSVIPKLKNGEALTVAETGAVKRYMESRIALRVRAQMNANPKMAIQDLILDKVLRDQDLIVMNNVTAGRMSKILDIRPGADNMSILQALRMLYGGKLPKDLMENLLDAHISGDPVAMQNAYDKIDDYTRRHQSKFTKFKNVMFSIMYEGMLAPMAAIKNLASNTVWLYGNAFVLKPLQTGIDAALSSKALKTLIPSLEGREQQLYFPELKAMQAMLNPFTPEAKASHAKAMEAARMAWVKGKAPANLQTKWELDIGSIGAAWKYLGKENQIMPDWFIKSATLFSRVMVATDVWFKSRAFDAQMQAEIVREMQRSGTSYNATNATPEMLEACHNFMNDMTFMNKPGDIAQAAYATRKFFSAIGLPGNPIIPFVNTVSNILMRGIEFTPGFGAVAKVSDIRKDMERTAETRASLGDMTKVRLSESKEFSDMLMKQFVGCLTAFVLLMAIWKEPEDDWITGNVPDDPKQALAFYAAGKRPTSFRVGKEWISYRSMEPINIVLSNIIAVRDALRTVKGKEDMRTATDRFTEAVASVVENILSSSYMDGVVRLAQDGKLQPAILGRIPANFIPYSAFLRQVDRMAQTYATGEYVVYENRKFLSAMVNTIPWTKEEGQWWQKQARINALGEEITVKVAAGGAKERGVLSAIGSTLFQWLPTQMSEAITDPVEEELIALGIYPGLPGRTMKIRNEEVEFDDRFYREYALLYGKYAKETIAKAMAQPGYQSKNAEQKRQLLNRRLDLSKARARLAGRRAWIASHPTRTRI